MKIENLANCPKHIPQIAAWLFHEWGHQVEGNSIETTISRIEKQLNIDSPPIFLVLQEGDHVHGVAALKIREMKEFPNREHWLGNVFVDPAARGKGYGSQLAEAVASRAKELDIKHLWLQTFDQQSLYALLGWNEVETIFRRDRVVSIMLREL